MAKTHRAPAIMGIDLSDRLVAPDLGTFERYALAIKRAIHDRAIGKASIDGYIAGDRSGLAVPELTEYTGLRYRRLRQHGRAPSTRSGGAPDRSAALSRCLPGGRKGRVQSIVVVRGTAHHSCPRWHQIHLVAPHSPLTTRAENSVRLFGTSEAHLEAINGLLPAHGASAPA